jgi:hypothetical protein
VWRKVTFKLRKVTSFQRKYTFVLRKVTFFPGKVIFVPRKFTFFRRKFTFIRRKVPSVLRKFTFVQRKLLLFLSNRVKIFLCIALKNIKEHFLFQFINKIMNSLPNTDLSGTGFFFSYSNLLTFNHKAK